MFCNTARDTPPWSLHILLWIHVTFTYVISSSSNPWSLWLFKHWCTTNDLPLKIHPRMTVLIFVPPTGIYANEMDNILTKYSKSRTVLITERGTMPPWIASMHIMTVDVWNRACLYSIMSSWWSASFFAYRPLFWYMIIGSRNHHNLHDGYHHAMCVVCSCDSVDVVVVIVWPFTLCHCLNWEPRWGAWYDYASKKSFTAWRVCGLSY